jgi:hypothetical protein
MRSPRCTVIFTIFLAAAGIANVAARQTPAITRGSITGLVVDARNGEPLPDAQIRLTGGSIDPVAYERLIATLAPILKGDVPPPGTLSPDELLEAFKGLAASNEMPLSIYTRLGAFRAANDARFRAVSDSEGRFAIGDLPPGRYTVRIQRAGYFEAGPAANIVSVAAGQPARVNLPMIPAGTISGRVTNNGKPISGVPVQAFLITYRNGYPVLQATSSRNTDDHGEYRLFSLTPGDYLVAATPRNSAKPKLLDVTEVSTPIAATTLASAEQPLRTYYPGTIDSTAAALVPIRVGHEVLAIDIPLKTSPLYRVSGDVRVFSIPVSSVSDAFRQKDSARAEVKFGFRNPDAPAEETALSQEFVVVTLKPAGDAFVGKFLATNIPPGFYEWKAEMYQKGADGDIRPTAVIPIEVRGADVEGLLLNVHPTVTVKGTVTVDEKPPGMNKVSVWLQAEGAQARKFGYQELAYRAVLADKTTGTFSISGVPVGLFRVMTGALPRNLYVADVRSGGRSVFDSGFDVGTDAPPPIEVALRSGSGSISGTVIDGNGKAVPGAVVALVPALPYRQNRARFHAGAADVSGRFSIGSVAPGEYQLFAFSAAIETESAVIPNGAYFSSAFLARFEEKGVAVIISGQAPAVTTELTVIGTQEQ